MEDAITDPWCHAKATDLRLLDGCGSSNNMKRKINATALNDIPSPCSDITESEPTVTSSGKKLKKLVWRHLYLVSLELATLSTLFFSPF